MIRSVTSCLLTDDEKIRLSKFNILHKLNLSDVYFGSKMLGNKDCVICDDACFGHKGYIPLPEYILNIIFKSPIEKLLSRLCERCMIVSAIGSKLCSACGYLLVQVNIIPNATSMKIDTKDIRYITYDNAKDILDKLGSNLANAITKVITILPYNLRESVGVNHRVVMMYIGTVSKAILDACNTTRDINIRYIESMYNNMIKNTSSTDSTIMSMLSSKNGLFRENMVGKRTNFCGRAVITGSDRTSPEYILLPSKMGYTLMVKLRCTDDNYDYLCGLVMRCSLMGKNKDIVTISQLKTNKNYYRRIQNGDRVLVNRQPSLSRFSIMSFKIIIKHDPRDYSITLNTAITDAFGADFDGDEMNILMASSEASIDEQNNICCLENNICDENGNVKIFPIQDAITISYNVSKYVVPIDKGLYTQICTVIDRYDRPYADGMTTLDLLSLSIPNGFVYNDNNIAINHGYISWGILYKSTIKSIIRVLYITGSDPLLFIHRLQRIVIEYNQRCKCYSTGVNDLIIPNINKDTLFDIQLSNPTDTETDIHANNCAILSNDIISNNINNNTMYSMIDSGAKGSRTNYCHMSISVGQIRTSNMPSGGEYYKSSYLEGLSPTEVFNSHKSSRESIITTHMITPQTGYIGRRLSKALSGVVVNNNMTVGDNNGYYDMGIYKNILIDENIIRNC